MSPSVFWKGPDSALGRRQLWPGRRGVPGTASRETALQAMDQEPREAAASPGASRIRPSSPRPNVASRLDYPAEFFCGWKKGADTGTSGVLLPRGGPKVWGKQQQPWPVHRSAPANPHDITFLS